MPYFMIDSTGPWTAQVADQPAGSTCTFIRRPQLAQNRGGSHARAAAHAS